MHTESRAFIEGAVAGKSYQHVLDIGARDINGSVRDLFPEGYVTLDISPGMNIEADAAEWKPDRKYDLVVCMSVLEHAPRWREIIATVHKALRKGGEFVLTTVSDPFPQHSAGGGPGDTWYENLTEVDLRKALRKFRISDFQTTPQGDLLVHAVKP